MFLKDIYNLIMLEIIQYVVIKDDWYLFISFVSPLGVFGIMQSL